MSPHETFFLTQTNSIEMQPVQNNDNIQFNVVDFPANVQFKAEVAQHISQCGALIYVIDAQQQDYESACVNLKDIIKATSEISPNIVYEVFIHKIDSDMFLMDDAKNDCLGEIHNNMRGLLAEHTLPTSLSFQLTSIYDHTIFEALSKVVQKLLPQQAFISSMLDSLISRSKIQKAFLFDVISKIYIATDSNPVSMKHYEICSELIDVLIDVTCIYGVDEDGAGSKFDKKSSSVIRLSHANPKESIVLYLREVDKCLALVCLISESEISKQHLINYNIDRFKEGLKSIFEKSNSIMSGYLTEQAEESKGAKKKGLIE